MIFTYLLVTRSIEKRPKSRDVRFFYWLIVLSNVNKLLTSLYLCSCR